MKLLVVDDHSVVREGLAALLRGFGADTVVITACDGPEALEIAARESDFDVVMLDLALPGMDGMKVMEELGARRPGLPVMVLSASEDPALVRRAMGLGALGYVPKSANAETLIAAIRLVTSGELYVPPFMLSDGGEAVQTGAPRLTPRQKQVLKGLGEGLPNKTIARDLGMSEKTVKAHITVVFRLLGATNRLQAVNLARRLRLI
jgi:DNA-binding NarL/FixJ family response regulator